MDYDKIRKYLLRLTHETDYENTTRWKEFVCMSFFQFLHEVGMFDTDNWTDIEAQQRARLRYLTALRLVISVIFK